MRTRLFALALALPCLLITAGACGESMLGRPPDDAGSGGSEGLGGAGSDDPHAGDLLVDDFEDGDATTKLGTDWSAYGDDSSGGTSEVGTQEWSAANGYAGTHSLSIAFTLSVGTSTFNPYVGLSAPLPSTTDTNSYEGLSYYYKGAAHKFRAQTSNVADYDFFAFEVPAATNWTLAVIPYEKLAQAGYGVAQKWDATLVDTLSWEVSAADGTAGTLELDDIYFEKSIELPPETPNLIVHDAEPPALVELTDIAIPGALQHKAMAQLDRGYNITNWLEEARFESYEYDEVFVEQLATAGFRALRLPVDLDLYIAAQTGSGDALAVTLDGDLTDILSNFDDWTASHGLSLTIDYHQYDGSLDLNDPASVDVVVALWRAVAEHFKDNPRDDVYFELMNEPELSSGAAEILPAAPWTAAATRIIAAIRAVDTKHTIIFGDVNWYGIDKLVQRTPFADTNIVYAFHSYDPFIFTHQGASWASMGTTHDVPYPYSPERWSTFGSELGLGAGQPAWVWDQFRNYYKNGNRNAIYNRVALAKAWGVENGVPVIVNEFGAYDRSARREDLIRYYTDLIDVYEELEIPWTHWFMILQEDGTVAPDYRSAFHLDQ